jgi:protein-L-isoaspartate(D-aspartate) O-methyltransferase
MWASMTDFAKLRRDMVERQIVSRGVRSPPVLDAMRTVPREAFLPQSLKEFAYEDSPLPIEAQQTISQPYIVAFMIEALDLEGGEDVLEIGAGSGYAAGVLSRVAGEVYTVERIDQLAEKAATTLADLGYHNVHVRHGDGTRGWPEHAPYDAIIVGAGGPEVPDSLKEQLKIGGRLVIPIGKDLRAQELVRVTRLSEDQFKTEDIADVRFVVPLIGEEGWVPEEGEVVSFRRPREKPRLPDGNLARAIATASTAFQSIETVDLAPLLRYPRVLPRFRAVEEPGDWAAARRAGQLPTHGARRARTNSVARRRVADHCLRSDPAALRHPTRCCPGRTPRPPRHRLAKAHAPRRTRAVGTRGHRLIHTTRPKM